MNGYDIDQIFIFKIVIGLALVGMGRQLFWLFIGGMGFMIGIRWAPQLFSGYQDWLMVITALLTGVVCAMFALALQRVAAGIAGFVAGYHIAMNALLNLGIEAYRYNELPYIIGGFFCAVMVLVFFDWALIVLSAVSGAILIVQDIPLTPFIEKITIIVLIVSGIGIQGYRMKDTLKNKNDSLE